MADDAGVPVPLTADERAEASALLAEADEWREADSSWRVSMPDDSGMVWIVDGEDRVVAAGFGQGDWAETDAALAALAKNLLGRLLVQVDGLEAERDALQGAIVFLVDLVPEDTPPPAFLIPLLSSVMDTVEARALASPETGQGQGDET